MGGPPERVIARWSQSVVCLESTNGNVLMHLSGKAEDGSSGSGLESHQLSHPANGLEKNPTFTFSA